MSAKFNETKFCRFYFFGQLTLVFVFSHGSDMAVKDSVEPICAGNLPETPSDRKMRKICYNWLYLCGTDTSKILYKSNCLKVLCCI